MTVELTLHAEPHDPPRVGWWPVTGAQDERDVRGEIELARTYHDGEPHTDYYRWFLYIRSRPAHNQTDTYMEIDAQGEAATLDEALDALREAWPTWLNDA